MAQPPLEDTIKLIRNGDSDHGRSYRQLKQSLEQIRSLYTSKHVLSAHELEIHDADSRTLLELANLAQLGSWLIDGSQNSLDEADESFLSMFDCQVSDLPAGMEELYLGIMTQRAVESLAVKEPEKPSEEVLGEILMSGLEDRLRGQHGGNELTSADQHFVSSVQSRKETLQGEAKEQPEPSWFPDLGHASSREADRCIAALREKHPLEELLRLYVKYVRERLAAVSHLGSKFGISTEIRDASVTADVISDTTVGHANTNTSANQADAEVDVDLDDLSSFFEKTASGLVQDALAGLTEETNEESTAEGGEHGAHTNGEAKATTGQTNGKIDLATDYKELEALVAESTSNYVRTTLHGLSPVPYQPTVPQSTSEFAMRTGVLSWRIDTDRKQRNPWPPSCRICSSSTNTKHSILITPPTHNLRPSRRPQPRPRAKTYRRIRRARVQRCTTKPVRPPCPRRHRTPGERAPTRRGGRGAKTRRRPSWLGLTWLRGLTGARSCRCSDTAAPSPIS